MTDLLHVPGLGYTHDQEPPDDGAREEGAPFQGKDGRALRRMLIADMIQRRVPHRLIATQLGCSKALITKEAAKIRAEWKERQGEAFDRHVAESLAVIDRARGVALGVMTGTHPATTKLAALDRVLAAEGRRAKLLGLDKPIEVDVTHHDTAAQRERADELMQRADELAARRQTG